MESVGLEPSLCSLLQQSFFLTADHRRNRLKERDARIA